MPNEACIFSLSLGWALTDESTGKDSWKATWGNWSVFHSFTLSLSRFLISLSVTGVYPSETLHVVRLMQPGVFLLQISFL